MTTADARSLEFGSRAGRRYWWHAGAESPAYIPPVYSFLTDEEWGYLRDWFDETDRRELIGECQVPLVSLLQGLIMGNQIRSIVQAGHYAGYSTLMVGFMLRRMGYRRGLYSIDIDGFVCDYTRTWVERVGLGEYVKVVQGDSAEPAAPERAREYLGRDPRIVFIDSSHTYGHTCRELELWYPRLSEGGLLICHDSADRAAAFDATGQGGVRRAIEEWKVRHPEVSCMSLAGTSGIHHRDGVYQDGCGVFLAQKPDLPKQNQNGH